MKRSYVNKVRIGWLLILIITLVKYLPKIGLLRISLKRRGRKNLLLRLLFRHSLMRWRNRLKSLRKLLRTNWERLGNRLLYGKKIMLVLKRRTRNINDKERWLLKIMSVGLKTRETIVHHLMMSMSRTRMKIELTKIWINLRIWAFLNMAEYGIFWNFIVSFFRYFRSLVI